MSELLNDAANMLIDGLKDQMGRAPLACDLHDQIYNSDFFYVWIEDAERVTNESGVWACISVVRDYELDAFGEVMTDLSDVFSVANNVLYIFGEALMNEIFCSTMYYNAKFDRRLSDDDLEDMIGLAEEWFESHSLLEVWNAL